VEETYLGLVNASGLIVYTGRTRYEGAWEGLALKTKDDNLAPVAAFTSDPCVLAFEVAQNLPRT
jgi:hypothetical protein